MARNNLVWVFSLRDELIYRVATDKWNNVLLYCDLILSPGDFLSLLEAHQMWSIYNMPHKFWDDFWRSINSWRPIKHLCQDTNILVVFGFLRGGRHLWTNFSQPFFHNIIMFLCLLKRKFPELFKTHPTFFSRAPLKAKMSTSTKITLLWEKPCSSLKRAPKNFWGIYYQMDHIWLAPSWLTTSQELKMRSQLSHTLFHLSDATL